MLIGFISSALRTAQIFENTLLRVDMMILFQILTSRGTCLSDQIARDKTVILINWDRFFTHTDDAAAAAI